MDTYNCVLLRHLDLVWPITYCVYPSKETENHDNPCLSAFVWPDLAYITPYVDTDIYLKCCKHLDVIIHTHKHTRTCSPSPHSATLSRMRYWSAGRLLIFNFLSIQIRMEQIFILIWILPEIRYSHCSRNKSKIILSFCKRNSFYLLIFHVALKPPCVHASVY